MYKPNLNFSFEHGPWIVACMRLVSALDWSRQHAVLFCLAVHRQQRTFISPRSGKRYITESIQQDVTPDVVLVPPGPVVTTAAPGLFLALE